MISDADAPERLPQERDGGLGMALVVGRYAAGRGLGGQSSVHL